MKFLDIINEHTPLLMEQDPGAPVEGAAAPEQGMVPEQGTDANQVTQVAPEGYTDIVRLLVKATAMNFPVGALDELYRTKITNENAFIIQSAVEVAIKQYETSGDNQERLQNPHYKQFFDSVNTKNFIEKLKTVESIIKSQNPYVK